MKNRKLSLRIRIFLAMILLTLLAFILIAVVTIYQYKEQADDYHIKRLGRKETAIKETINFELLRRTSFPLETRYLPVIFREKIHEIKAVHKLDLDIYDLSGKLLISSYKGFKKDTTNQQISKRLLKELASKLKHRVVLTDEEKNENIQSSYSYIKDNKFKNIGILRLTYVQDNSEQKKELNEFLSRLSLVYIFIFIIAIALAYLLSTYITRTIKTVSEKMKQTRLNKRNEKIHLNNASAEISLLINSYNDMIDELEDSAVKLAQSEREQAWREMAKQVAHEIKNPLTPMRLTVQSFERKFDAQDPAIKEKVKEYSKTLIQQIDTMSSIASAFSDFAKMPTQKKETVNVVEVVKLSIDLFSEDYISFYASEENIELQLDKNQLIRVINNLVKNAKQAVASNEKPKIEVSIILEKNTVSIKVADNGKGISDAVKDRVFEPKFTTKSSGMGLGLPMVKNIIETYGGNISFTSTEDVGTVFTVKIPK